MKIELSSPMLQAMLATRTTLAPGVAEQGDGTGGTGFAQVMKSAISQVDGQQHAANDTTAAVESGQSDDLIGAMLSSQEANLSFSMMMQVRNKLMSAFDDIIKMQV
ncbi:flagellar hook-basal body complex protein FliE [Dyella acidiphila]|uniref:Flagellar hook-basal body complex protein FliE n=1 Tax=Dyella acidiphila TaxID=2775866 RepID=A0ABR9G971_9GAMM|nr:flagellar hook-basal body complex protein FliE [Dyella acidiphila]MBE1160597.1 flagellar hook-basal body complex protein FliE [Dyella acidiphila]